MRKLFFIISFIISIHTALGQNVNEARDFNKLLLKAITNDLARPTVHARNLFHLSALTYDMYAVYFNKETYFLGKNINGYNIPFDGKPAITDTISEMKEAICFASYRLLKHRFQNSPGVSVTYSDLDNYMLSHGYDISNISTSYLNTGAAEFGNYVAEQIINYGLQDGSNETNNYANTHYTPTNPALEMVNPGNPDIIDPNKWQAIEVPNAIDQAGNPVFGAPPHLSPEWGNVNRFSLHDTLKTQENVNGDVYTVFCDPGHPAYIDTTDPSGLDSFYKWNFCMVPIWQSHLDPSDGVVWDASPNSIGNLPQNYPQNNIDIDTLYDYFDGGHIHEQGYPSNPKTGLPYDNNNVRRADYARVLAEFWADGLDSETPPGHWFKIYHEISEHPDFEFKWMGVGQEMDTLFYDILAHFTLGGMMHDAAIAAWSIKGRYDYVRPASAIRYMGDKGQCSDPGDLSYHPAGLPIIPNYIELVYPGDPLSGSNNENVGKMKLYTWRGPDYIPDPEVDFAGVGWILSENWWPYQRPSFVTPPFAGYISGHSTFSTTAAEVLTLITGDPFFPGGVSEFEVLGSEFLEFENGPSTTFKLQWATYRDAANQCSLSRIWGGIHPPVDDIPGRIIGQKIGPLGTIYADSIISIEKPSIVDVVVSDSILNIDEIGNSFTLELYFSETMNTLEHPHINYPVDNPLTNSLNLLNQSWINDTVYQIEYELLNASEELFEIVLQVDSALSTNNKMITKSNFKFPFVIDLVEPTLLVMNPSHSIVSEPAVNNSFHLDLTFSEKCNIDTIPELSFIQPLALQSTFIHNLNSSEWLSDTVYRFEFSVVDNNEYYSNIELQIENVYDLHGNLLSITNHSSNFVVDTESPLINMITSNKSTYTTADIGFQTVVFTIEFSKEMDISTVPDLSFPNSNALDVLTINPFTSQWLNPYSYEAKFNLENDAQHIFNISVQVDGITDTNLNTLSNTILTNIFNIDTKRPSILDVLPSTEVIYDGNVGSNGFYLDVAFNEVMDQLSGPQITLSHPDFNLNTSLVFNPFSTSWLNDSIARCYFNVQDQNIEVDSLLLSVDFAKDSSGNMQNIFFQNNFVDLDTKNPSLIVFNASSYDIDNHTQTWESLQIYDEPMDQNIDPELIFSPIEVSSILDFNINNSFWLNETTYTGIYEVIPSDTSISSIVVSVIESRDLAGNIIDENSYNNFLDISLSNLKVINEKQNHSVIYPNPASSGSRVVISFVNNIDISGVTLTDNAGRILKKSVYDKTSNLFEFELPIISRGNYFINIKSNRNLTIHKLIIN